MAYRSSAEQWAQAVLDGETHVQPGTLSLRVLDQNQIWVDETGRVHMLADMDERYLTNLLTYLLVRAGALQRRLAIGRVCEMLEAADEDVDPVEIGHIAVRALDALECAADPAAWLSATPLATAITGRLACMLEGSITRTNDCPATRTQHVAPHAAPWT